jgi:hypothetical protein
MNRVTGGQQWITRHFNGHWRCRTLSKKPGVDARCNPHISYVSAETTSAATRHQVAWSSSAPAIRFYHDTAATLRAIEIGWTVLKR